MSNYSKHKERRPEDTVFSIQTILNRAGLFTTVEWMDRPFEGVCSNRVMIYPTKLGVNGKGTDEVYTLASGYAELMERMQNDLLTMRCLQPEMTGYSGFNRQPDERLMTPEEILAQHDPFLTYLFKALGIIGETQKTVFLRSVSEPNTHREDDRIPVIPFADPENRKVVWLPYTLLLCLYGSNGMAAGNTIEEALVQGISELFERYVNVKLLEGECIPPQIPDEAFAVASAVQEGFTKEEFVETMQAVNKANTGEISKEDLDMIAGGEVGPTITTVTTATTIPITAGAAGAGAI